MHVAIVMHRRLQRSLKVPISKMEVNKDFRPLLSVQINFTEAYGMPKARGRSLELVPTNCFDFNRRPPPTLSGTR